jgi:hypothetical protein
LSISPAWKLRNQKEQQVLLDKYEHLFTMNTKYQACPIDRFELVSAALPSSDFLFLVQKLGYVKYFPNGKPYLKCYNLGCVIVFSEPIYPNTPLTKIVINPSEAGLKLHQIILWVRFITGNRLWKDAIVTKAEIKIDLRHTRTTTLKKKIWWFKPFRTIDKFPYGLYLGGRKSDRLVIYDKGKQMGLKNYSLTRIELRYRYRKVAGKKRTSIIEFFRTFFKADPFSEVGIVTSKNIIINLLVKSFGQVSKETFVETIKELGNTYRKKKLLQRVSINKSFLSRIYIRQRDKWLRH